MLAITPGAARGGRRGRSTTPATAWNARDCATAIDAALTATERFGARPEPWLVLAYCDARLGDYTLARRAVDAARERDPDNWQFAYGQAIVYGVSGADPLPVRRGGAAAEPARAVHAHARSTGLRGRKDGGPPPRGRADGPIRSDYRPE